MATGGPPVSNKRESLTCSLCLNIFTSPKLLPCHHTFCERCLTDLAARHDNRKFPCPQCRKETEVPPGGVSAFQSNFYMDAEDLERARDDTHCMVHLAKELEFFCVKCEAAICLNCKLTEHELHETQDLVRAASRAKAQLSDDLTRLTASAERAKEKADEAKKEVQLIRDKKAEVAAGISRRHATLVAAADKYRDEAMAALETVSGEILTTQDLEVERTRGNLQELTTLQQRVQQALDSGAGSDLVTVAGEMRRGRGSEEAVQKLTTKQMTTVCRPVLRFSATPDDTLQRMRDYIGNATKMEMPVSAPEVTVVKQFRCREDADTDVYHVCLMTDNTLWVSYEPHTWRDGVGSEKFSAEGRVVRSVKCDIPGRITRVRRKDGKAMYPIPKTGVVSTYAKWCEPDLVRHFILFNSLTGQADIYTEKIVSEDPLKTEYTKEFTIQCGAQRAFDVAASQQLLVVLQEARTPDGQRSVRLYRRPQPDAIATYSPPVAECQPSDVCFYTLGGQEVLLVADELNDAIHVVNVQDGRLSFARYLAPGCPLLVQPTALNTDTRGRLWVACRGGSILTCTPIA